MKLWPKRRQGQKLNVDGLPVVTLPADYLGSLNLYGLRGSYGQIYRTQPNVRAVVDFLASEVASVNLKLYEKVPAGPFLPSGRLELSDHLLQRLLDSPAPNVTRSRHWFSTVADLCVYDVAYWQKIRLGGKLRALVRVPPTSLVPDRDPVTQRIRTYYTTLGRREVPLNQLVIFAGYDPEQQDGNVSPLETLRRTLAEEDAAGRHRENMWANAARKSGVVERPVDVPAWSPAARAAWRADWEATMTGARNAGRTALLEDGMTWKEGSWNPEQMQYLESRKLTRQECAAAFRVDPTLVYATDRKVDAADRTAFYVDRFVPLLTQLAEEVDLQLLPEFELFEEDRVDKYSEFNIDEKLRGSFVDQAAIASAAVGGPFVTVNEMRARLNLPPKDDGDEIYVPMNSTRGGGPQGSPQQPVDSPAQSPTTSETPGDGIAPKSKARKVAPARALARRQTVADLYQLAFQKHFNRQLSARSVTGDRWDRELAADLQKVTEPVVDENAKRAMRQLARKAAYDPERTRAYIAAAVAGIAANVNRKTRLDLEDVEDMADVLGEAAAGRAVKDALWTATQFVNFGRLEGGKQAGAKQKTWIVTSANSRHPEMDGETAEVGEEFSNGLAYPGDVGDPSETANCQCLLSLG